jgi:hypothetical protein
VGNAAIWAANSTYDSRAHLKIKGGVSFAGGRGGHKDGIPNNNCSPEVLIEAAEH